MAERQQQGKDMTVKVLACRATYHGHNKRGDEFTIYEIDAAKQDGTLINEKLRSFASLPIGQDVEVTVVPYVSEQYGKSFTLYPKHSRSHNFSEAINGLTERIEALEKEVAALKQPSEPTIPGQSEEMTQHLDAEFGKDPPY